MSKSKKDIRNNRAHSSSSSCTTSSLSSDEEIDAKDLKPIKEYLSDRKELARQLFKSVKPDKIQMMLPQILKQIDLNELEEWCVSELNGMSKARILAILTDKSMLESSDTSESDDSGPSLEIISDTEEWLTDDDTYKKEKDGKKKIKRGKTKIKGKTQIKKTNDLDKFNMKEKCDSKNGNNDRSKDIKIKKEDDKEKDKEGDSLLDLLELEMRARAIRALIRKEEDIIPSSNNLPQISDSQTIENNTESLQDDAKAKENCRKQLERIINAKQGNIGEDEDVVLVIQPAPVVELLSSESDKEDHGGTRVNKKLESERVKETGKSKDDSNEYIINSKLLQGLKERKEIQEEIHTNIVSKIELNMKNEKRTKLSERNVDIKNNTLSISISADNIAERRKKSKKRSRTKSQIVSSACNADKDSQKIKQINITETVEISSDIKNKSINDQSQKSPTFDGKKIIVEDENNIKEQNMRENRIEKETSADLDEIIDLDAYCDVMDIENCEEDKSEDKAVIPFQENKQSISQTASNPQNSDSSETWASRYYQTDDVQNVIKESKIQTEIRKRLRERQRLFKLKKSPNGNSSPQPSTNHAASSTPEKIPTGSVEEYLALKRASNVDVNVTNNNSNNIMGNNSATSAVSNSDVRIQENVAQDDNISSKEGCTDSINNATNVDYFSSSLSAKSISLIACRDAEITKAQNDT